MKNQTLKLLLKGVTLAALIFSYEYTLLLTYLILFGLLLSIFYFRPGVQNGRFLVPLVLGIFLVLAIPPGLSGEIYMLFSVFMGAIFALVLGLKNHAFVNKEQVYSFINLSVASIFVIFFFYGILDTKLNLGNGVSSIVLFGAIFLALRDLSILSSSGLTRGSSRLSFLSAFTAFIVLEIAWALSILPVNYFLKAIAVIMAIGALWLINFNLKRII